MPSGAGLQTNAQFPTVTVIMPAYNSEGVIEGALKSVKNQTYPADKIEILVIDGGSSDATLSIAAKYGARIMNNEKRLPEFAKEIGFFTAKGKYGIFLDTDERLINPECIERRVNFFLQNDRIKVITSTGGPAPKCGRGANRYACNVGDPFSAFVYHFYNGADYMSTATRQFKYAKVHDGVIFDYSDSDYLPLYDGLAQMFDIPFVKSVAEKFGLDNITTDLFCNITNNTGCSGMLYDDYIIHDQQMDGKKYISKIKWRIKNNLFAENCVGYSARSVKQRHLNIRKYLFVLYSVSIIPVLFMTLLLTFRHKDLYMLMHFVYTEITFAMICWYMMLKILHVNVKKEVSYGNR